MTKTKKLPKVEAGYTVDPLSDLVSAQELRVWRSHPTTTKITRYLTRWRSQLVESMADGGTTANTAEATAMLTTESVSKATLLKDILTLEARDVADFYNLAEPQEAK